jgi:hypothetical protein
MSHIKYLLVLFYYDRHPGFQMHFQEPVVGTNIHNWLKDKVFSIVLQPIPDRHTYTVEADYGRVTHALESEEPYSENMKEHLGGIFVTFNKKPTFRKPFTIAFKAHVLNVGQDKVREKPLVRVPLKYLCVMLYLVQ